MDAKTFITCRNCGKDVYLNEIEISHPDAWSECPECGEVLPIEGHREKEYVIVCPWAYCQSVFSPKEILENDGRCPACEHELPLYLTKRFPCEIMGKMCVRHQDEDDFDPEEFDDSECQDCHEDGCRFVDPNWWEEERKSWGKIMNTDDDDDDDDEYDEEYKEKMASLFGDDEEDDNI